MPKRASKQPPGKRRVISVGGNPELLWLRESVLKAVGYEVFTFTQLNDAVSRVRSGDCGVLLLCYSMPGEPRKQLIEEYRERCPEGRIVVITNHPVIQTPKDADQLVYGVEGPEALIEAVQGNGA